MSEMQDAVSDLVDALTFPFAGKTLRSLRSYLSVAEATIMAQATTTISGTVRKLVKDKGFGFVQGMDGVDYFFYRDAVDHFDELTEGTAVLFVPGQGEKGPRASQVQVA